MTINELNIHLESILQKKIMRKERWSVVEKYVIDNEFPVIYKRYFATESKGTINELMSIFEKYLPKNV